MQHRRRQGYLLILTVFFLIICLVRFTAARASSGIELTAHRGDSAHYPENTMAAFQAAADLGVDCIELDVQQSADQVLVVCHDQGLARTTGVDQNIREMSYQEIRKLDAGSWYSARFAEERIPSLEKVLKMARGDHLKLNLEIKDSDSGGTLVKQLVGLVRRYRMQGRCLVASQDYGVLRQVKRDAPEMTTLYIMDAAGEDLGQLPDADEISIPYAAVTAQTVQQAHASGKRIHAWTVDQPEAVRAMTALKVDDMITDNPELVKLIWNTG